MWVHGVAAISPYPQTNNDRAARTQGLNAVQQDWSIHQAGPDTILHSPFSILDGDTWYDRGAVFPLVKIFLAPAAQYLKNYPISSGKRLC